jgi:hypothetical protein
VEEVRESKRKERSKMENEGKEGEKDETRGENTEKEDFCNTRAHMRLTCCMVSCGPLVAASAKHTAANE